MFIYCKLDDFTADLVSFLSSEPSHSSVWIQNRTHQKSSIIFYHIHATLTHLLHLFDEVSSPFVTIWVLIATQLIPIRSQAESSLPAALKAANEEVGWNSPAGKPTGRTRVTSHVLAASHKVLMLPQKLREGHGAVMRRARQVPIKWQPTTLPRPLSRMRRDIFNKIRPSELRTFTWEVAARCNFTDKSALTIKRSRVILFFLMRSFCSESAWKLNTIVYWVL